MTDPERMVWDTVLADPTVPLDPATLRLVVADQQRWSRRWLYPWVRVASRIAVAGVGLIRWLVPVRLSAHGLMDALCVWFLRRFVDPGAVTLLVRHFVVETNLLNFVLRNTFPRGHDLVTLRPTTLAGLGDRAVIIHDINVYEVLTALRGQRLDPVATLDFDMLEVPAIDPEPHRRRLLRLDIQTALCLMNIPFAMCLTWPEYRRAVHSMRLDTSLLAVLAALTGDPVFHRWRPAGSVVRLDTTSDVPRAVYEHALACEFAHETLLRMRAAKRLRAVVGAQASIYSVNSSTGMSPRVEPEYRQT
ncbi:hypothetical protein SAMN05421812_10766 [Asanoa hainanensis]|uniref:Uncharacterized protein n=1 Tax=Asanoa hainanensis TaxID=560556 RepID=A0A239MZF8_9ACTN|nr:hypothetical protein [Asanoa hainanensis]SNT48157.1 hypothetical protein SAMN05421812_10766 [Asanoa hainanensis]